MRTSNANERLMEEISDMLATNKSLDMDAIYTIFENIAVEEATELLKKVEFYHPTKEAIMALIETEYEFEAEVELIVDNFRTYPYMAIEMVSDTYSRITFSSTDIFTEEEFGEEIQAHINIFKSKKAENFKQYKYNASTMIIEAI